MAYRLEVITKVNDTRSKVLRKKLNFSGFTINSLLQIDVYTITKKFTANELLKIGKMLANPITQDFIIDESITKIYPQKGFDFALEIGFLPGVTDNTAHTTKESIADLCKVKFKENEDVYSSKLIFLRGKITKKDAAKIGNFLANDLIQRIHLKTFRDYLQDKGMDKIVPKVQLKAPKQADKVNLKISEAELIKLGKEGILNSDGSRRGPLALDKDYLEAIKIYFYEVEKRHPNDIELESIAQTWSEHCKHTIFADPIDELKEGLYKGYIKKATQEIRKRKGKKDFCVSVFSDNSGGIIFDENWIITDKAETHNSPSALDPFGGSITGIVGVNRDCIGFGQGAKPIINKYGFCVGNPEDEEPIYRDKQKTKPALSPKRIFSGIVEGVNVGGNCSGIPTPLGFVSFDHGYKGKPLVFVGTVGILPAKIKGKKGWLKKAKKGDKIVLIGGRTGQDGIHGATFSSEALTSGSPATAVQIGDPFTQKKLSDALINDARQMQLYNSITDNGAGGISCSVAEMAKECGGCTVELEKVPLKYPNLEPWKIWISESQERMTLAVSPKNIRKFTELMEKRGVETSVIGEFNNSGRCVVKYHDKKIMDMNMNFLHNGLPKKFLKTTLVRKKHPEPKFPQPKNLNNTLLKMLARPNICSYEFISKQYDHNVQGNMAIGPLQGKGRVNGNSCVVKPLFDSKKAVICSYGLNPLYSHIDTYHMSACAIDTAIRNTIATGGTLEHLALMDNFCWCSSNEPERLGQLKESVRACYEYAIKYETPYISGKDSMFNDFRGYDKKGREIKISIPPTLLISSLGVVNDVSKTIGIDPKFAGDAVYLIGESKMELGASEYYYFNDSRGEKIGNSLPQVNAKIAIQTYQKFTKAAEKNLIASAISPSLGGLGVSLAKMAIAGQLGLKINLKNIPGAKNFHREDFLLFSESQSRFLVTVNPENEKIFLDIFSSCQAAKIGIVTKESKLIITGLKGQKIIETPIQKLEEKYKSTFKNY